MKRTLLALAGLTLTAAAAEAVLLVRIHLDPWRLAALLESLALLLGAFVAFTQADFVQCLRKCALHSVTLALLIPFGLLIPYLVLALATHTFSLLAIGKLSAYLAVPTILLLPDRVHSPERASWRDFAAIVSMGWPVGAGWLGGIWIWPQDIYIFRPLFCVCAGAYSFLVMRDLKEAGYSLLFKKDDLKQGAIRFMGFTIIAIPLGLALHFIHPHARSFNPLAFLADFVGIYLTIAIPEEFLFRGILQNLLAKTFKGPRHELYGLTTASVVFGLSHLHHAPVPNWRYAIMATVAGLFYGNAWRVRKRTCASAFAHATVDTVWHFWF